MVGAVARAAARAVVRARLQHRRLMPAGDGARALLVVEGRDSAELDRAVLGQVLRRPLQRLGHIRRVDDHRLLTVAASLELAGDSRHLIAVGGVIAAANVEERHLLLLVEKIGVVEKIGRAAEEKIGRAGCVRAGVQEVAKSERERGAIIAHGCVCRVPFCNFEQTPGGDKRKLM